MRRVHFVSGITLSVFIALHLANHAASVFGSDSHLVMMEVLRSFYRNLAVESLLLVAVFVQIVSGVQLFLTSNGSTGRIDKLHRWSGMYMAIFLVIHVAAVFAGRLVLSLDTNFYFGVAGLNSFPLNLFFIPYYAFAILSFFTHVAAIHSKKMKAVIFGVSPENQGKAILIFGIVCLVVIFYGLTNGFSGVSIPEDYNVLVGK